MLTVVFSARNSTSEGSILAVQYRIYVIVPMSRDPWEHWLQVATCLITRTCSIGLLIRGNRVLV